MDHTSPKFTQLHSSPTQTMSQMGESIAYSSTTDRGAKRTTYIHTYLRISAHANIFYHYKRNFEK